MPTIQQILGKVSIVPRGAYNSSTTYAKLDVVTYNGSSYMALLDTVGNDPTNTTYWQLLSQKGDKGDNAKINNQDAVNIVAGTNIEIQQEGSTLTIIANIPSEYVTETEMENYAQPVGNYALNSNVYSKSDTNTLLNGKADKTSLNDLFKNVTYDSSTGALTFTQYDNSTIVIDLPLELIVTDGYYDSDTKEIVLVLANQQEIRIPADALVNEYYADGTTIELNTVNGKLTFSVKNGVYQPTEAGKGLSTNDFDNTYKNNVDSNTTARHSHTNKEVLDETTASYSTEEQAKLVGIEEHANNYVLPTGSPTVKGGFKVGNNLSVREDGTLDANVTLLTKYGIKRKITGNSSSAWERLDDNVGLVAQATKDGSAVTNDFNNIYPWSGIKSYNFNNGEITAWYGDANFKFDGTNGDVLTYIPEFYYKRYVEDDYEYIYISQNPFAGYTKSEAFSVGRYKMSESNNVGHSISGANVSTNRTITSHRTIARALGTGFGQLDWRYFLLQMLYLVEYADYNSQSKLGNGITGLTYNASVTALKAEESANRIIVATTYANSFIVGQQVDVGTSLGGRQIATYRTITEINAYDDGTITGTEIIFDGAPINIALGNILYSCGQNSGGCDTLGMLSGCLNNDSKHSIIYRGVEDIFGNVFEWVDGLNIKDYVSYINYNPETYAVDTFTGDYQELGYTNADTDGYAKTLGYDANNPIVALTTSIGGGSTTYMCDYYYRATGNRVACVGGGFYHGSAVGLWYWYCYDTSSFSYLSRGARLLRYQS